MFFNDRPSSMSQRKAISTARRLSALVRLAPCVAFERMAFN